MLFNSLTFLVFFLVFYTLFIIFNGKKYRSILITLGSYVFYGFWNAPFVLLLILSTVVDFNIGKVIFKANNRKVKKIGLIFSLCLNLGMLFYFKYFNLFIDTAYSFISLFGGDVTLPHINVILPVGISFYTFQTLSYTIDIYRGELEPEKDIWTFAAFVAFFPQLVAGPILRAKAFLPQLHKKRSFNWDVFYQGLFLVVFGLFKKTVIADNLAPLVERIYDNTFLVSCIDAWVSTLAFTFQIYFDFSGYTDIAIGLALILGFYIPDNFNSPYAAITFSDFWRRWHISLSSWLKDYLYIPLGGNRKSISRTNINLLITMFLGGLWHGAAWNFVVWGLMHGFYLLVERSLGLNKVKTDSTLLVFIRRVIVFFFIVLTWVMFRADFSRGIEIMASMFGFCDPTSISFYSFSNVFSVFAITLVILCFNCYFYNKKIINFFRRFEKRELIYTIGVSVILFCIIMFKGSGGAFIYFQF